MLLRHVLLLFALSVEINAKPEIYAGEKSQEGAGEDWELSIRTCSEKLFLDLMINYKDSLVQPLLAVFQSVASTYTAL